MSRLRDLQLVDASVPADATFARAVSTLFAAQVPAIAVVGAEGRVLGILAEGDVLRAIFPRYLAELHHTSFLSDDPAALDELLARVRDREVSAFARQVDVLSVDESESHAAERFMHSGEPALPVVDAERFVGMLSVAALCQMRIDRPGDA